MKIRITIPMLAVLAGVVAGVSSAPASAAGGATKPTLVIRHQVHGCHSWSLGGGAFKPSQAVTIHRGGSVSITNNDVMPHKLVETSGPAVTITRLNAGMPGMMGLKGTFPPAMMARMSSAAKVTFRTAGVYKFTTKPGEDYMPGPSMKTIGADNVLRLTVTVR
jgi:plastocyanin